MKSKSKPIDNNLNQSLISENALLALNHTNAAMSPQSLISKSSGSVRRSKSSFNNSNTTSNAFGGKSTNQANSPLSTNSNNIIPISYNELEVNDNVNQNLSGIEHVAKSLEFNGNQRDSKRSIKNKSQAQREQQDTKQMSLDDFELIRVSEL